MAAPGSGELAVHCSLLTVRPEGSDRARLRQIADAGFDGVQTVPPPTEREQQRFGRLLDEVGLEASGCGHLAEDEPAEPLFQRAAAVGMVSLNLQVDGYWRDDRWQDRRVTELLELSGQFRIPFFLETHRGRLTQDLRRTLALVARHPALSLCGDFSHYTVASELRAPWPREWRDALALLARRCGEVQVRLNGGQRVQDPLPLVGAAQQAEFFALWRTARAAWPGSRFLVTTELLPASIGYAAVDLGGAPVGDIWQDTRTLLGVLREQSAAPAVAGR